MHHYDVHCTNRYIYIFYPYTAGSVCNKVADICKYGLFDFKIMLQRGLRPHPKKLKQNKKVKTVFTTGADIFHEIPE